MSVRFTPPAFIVKVCGITNLEDAQAAINSGANALGFNFYSRSPRYIKPSVAESIISKLSADFLSVGVFVSPNVDEMAAASTILKIVQIHGFMPQVFPENMPPVWRAIGAGTEPPPDSKVEAWLLDSPTPAFGGSGKTFDWAIASRFPYRAIIAGGLDASNVSEAIRVASPWGVDSCSRLESAPGKKDHQRMSAFILRSLDAFARQTVNI